MSKNRGQAPLASDPELGRLNSSLPIAAGVFEPAFGLVLRPEARLQLPGAVNVLLLKRLRLPVQPVADSAASVRSVEHAGHGKWRQWPCEVECLGDKAHQTLDVRLVGGRCGSIKGADRERGRWTSVR